KIEEGLVPRLVRGHPSEAVIGVAAMSSGYGLFGEEHEAFRSTVKQFVERELKPNASKWEEAEEFPLALYKRCAELGMLGLRYPVEYGGSDAGPIFEAVLIEELAKCGSGGVAAGLGAQFTISTGPIWRFGNDDQKRRFLAPAIRG